MTAPQKMQRNQVVILQVNREAGIRSTNIGVGSRSSLDETISGFQQNRGIQVATIVGNSSQVPTIEKKKKEEKKRKTA
jgi:hypothetical protein